MTVPPQGDMHPRSQQFRQWDLRSPCPRMGTDDSCMFVLLFFCSSPMVFSFLKFILDLLQFFNDFLFLSCCFSFLVSTHIISVKPGCCFQPKNVKKATAKSLCSQRYFQHTHATEWFCPPLEGPETASLFPRQ